MKTYTMKSRELRRLVDRLEQVNVCAVDRFSELRKQKQESARIRKKIAKQYKIKNFNFHPLVINIKVSTYNLLSYKSNYIYVYIYIYRNVQ